MMRIVPRKANVGLNRTFTLSPWLGGETIPISKTPPTGTEKVPDPEVPLRTVRDAPGQTVCKEEALRLIALHTTTRRETCRFEVQLRPIVQSRVREIAVVALKATVG
jgi:hypothetical protein